MSERQPSVLSAARLALSVNRLRQQMPDVDLLASDPLAIVGIGCRFPGNIQSPGDFWQLLLSGGDAITTVPSDRWNAEAYYDPNAHAPGKTNTKWGGFVHEPASFDPHLFGIAPREAPSVDPQQRLLLEVSWEAIWDSGRSPESLAGSRAGVFTGITRSDYERLLFEDANTITANSCTGVYHSVATGRLSYLLDLRGPSVSVDTACSSSLVAVHAACQSLRSGECDLALAGGVNLQLLPEHYVGLAKLGVLASDGRCKTFDASADGFVPSEGCGVIVLKRLSDALADGDRIYAVIRGTATNQDGRTSSLTAPSGLAQEDVVRRALENGRVTPESIAYVETHGTGTVLGDPIEIEALGAVLGSESLTAEPCFLGAVKTNLGHLEAAAGIAGLIKASLALYYQAVPANIHFERLNPHIALGGTRFVMPAHVTPWPRGPKARFAGVSSFGFSGTNAHVVMEEAPRVPESARRGAAHAPGAHLLPISARTPDALTEFARRYQAFLREDGRQLALSDICDSASRRRSHYEERVAIAACSHDEFCNQLEDFVSGRSRHGLANGRAAQDAGGIVFVCSGQGSQWAQMGMMLFRQEPLFRAALQECDDCGRRLAGWSLLDEILLPRPESKLDETEYAQPALLAIEVALARLWESWGVRPAAVIGHSAGEVAAACIAGILSLDEAMRIVIQRGRLMQAATGQGKMAIVRLPATAVAKDLAAANSQVSIAAVNSPHSTVISGGSEAVQALVSHWLARGIASRLLPVNYAFHSAQMQAYSDQLVHALGPVKTESGATPFLSTVLGRAALSHEVDAAYWGSNIRRTVQFRTAVDVAIAMGYSTFLEVGPHPVLLTSVAECLSERGVRGVTVSSLRRNEDERKSMLASLGGLYVAGQPISWTALCPEPGPPVPLPAYPYQRQRFWIQRTSPLSTKNPLHPLVGNRLQSPAIRSVVFEAEVGTAALAYLADHVIEGEAVVPMAALLEMAAWAARQIFNSAKALEDVCVLKRLSLPSDGQSVTVQLVYEGNHFQIFSRTGDEWLMHASGRATEPASPGAAPEPWIDGEGEASDPDFYYERWRESGARFGPAFRTITSILIGNGRARAEVRLRDADRKEAAQYGMHPALLDGCLQVAVAALGECKGLFLPFAVDRVECFEAPGDAASVEAVLRPSATGDVQTADIEMRCPDGRLLARISGTRYKRAASAAPDALPSGRRLYTAEWRRAERGAAELRPEGTWLISADDPEPRSALVSALENAGLTAAALREDEGLEGRPCAGVIRLVCSARAEDPMGAQVSVCGTTLRLVQDLLRGYPGKTPQFMVVTCSAVVADSSDTGEGFQSAPVWGLVRTVALEHPELRCLLADVDNSTPSWATLAAEVAWWDGEGEIAFRSGERFVRRLVEMPAANRAPRQWTVSARGSIENLTLEGCERRAPEPREVEIEVEANALNFRDVLNVLGMYPGDAGQPGVEFCGRVTRVGAEAGSYVAGERVMGIAWHSLRRFVTAPVELVVRAPAGLNAVEAATLPNAFLTAYHCLVHLGRLRRGERVLIHCASGGVGLAAVQLAQYLGADVFATAGSEKKRAYLRSLGVRHTFSSRTNDFAEEIAAIAGPAGIDLILNSLTGNSIDASFSLLANGGRFVEIGVRNIWSPDRVRALDKNIAYFTVNLAEQIDSDRALVQAHLRQISSMVAGGALRALAASAFPFEQAPLAFRHMAEAKHIGKVVLQHPVGLRVSDRLTYLITGGLGAIGLHFAEWLAGLGARSLVLVSRGTPNPQAISRIEGLRSAGVSVQVRSADVARLEEMESIFADMARGEVSLGGVIHAAGVVDDGLVAEQSWRRFERVMAPKVAGSWNLHQLTSRLPLDFFIMCSSMAGLTGSPGQAAYAASNAFLDALSSYRRARGLPALSVNWGPWAGDGMAARVNGGATRLSLPALRPMEPEKCFASLSQCAGTDTSQVAIVDVDWSRWKGDPRLVAELTELASTPRKPLATEDISSRLEAAPRGNRRQILVDFLRAQAQLVLGLNGNGPFIDEHQPLLKMGMDSLMAVEFRNSLMTALGRNLSSTLLFDHPTIGDLTEFLEGKSDRETAPARDALLEELDNLSDEEAEELLKAELERS